MSSLLIDLGGTDLKFGLTDESGIEISHFKRLPMPKLIKSRVFRSEIDTSSLISSLNLWINWYLEWRKDVKRILISGQMGCWAVGDLNSIPRRVVSWQDLRSMEKYQSREKVIDKFGLNLVISRNGREIEPGVPLLGLLTSLDEVSATRILRYRSLLTLVVEALIGRPSKFIHITDAASSGMINMNTNDWDEFVSGNLLKQVELPEVTCELIPAGTLIGTDIEIYVGVGDQQASLLGVGISDRNLVLNIGTGGQVATMGSIETRFPVKIRPFFGRERIVTYTHLLSGRFLNLVLETACEVYQSKFNHGEFSATHNIRARSATIFEVDKCLDKDYLSREAEKLTPSEFIDSAIQTMSNQYVNAINEIGGLENKSIVFAGGVGQKNIKLSSSIISMFGNPDYSISEERETTLAGLRKLSYSIST